MLFSRMSPNMPVQNLISTCPWCCLLCSVHMKPRQTPMQNNIPVYSYSHSAQSKCCINTDYQRCQNICIFVKCEQHSTKTHKFNSGSMVITWSSISSEFTFSAISVTWVILSFKTGHVISTTKRCQTIYIKINSVLQNFKWNYHVHRSLPEIPVMNQKHPIQNSHFVLLKHTFILSSNQYEAA